MIHNEGSRRDDVHIDAEVGGVELVSAMVGPYRYLAIAISMLTALTIMPSPASASNVGHQGKIAFEKDSDIYVMDGDGSNVVQLTTYPAQDSDPLWSPDGTRLAFISNRGRAPGASGVDIYVVELSSGQTDRVTSNSTGGAPSSWSVDGASILYVGGDGAIQSVDVESGATTSLTGPATGDFPTTLYDSPVFSPDGSRIAYTERSRAFLPGGGSIGSRPKTVYTSAIFLTDPNGSNTTRLTNTPAAPGSPTKWTDDDQFPTWSPDGSQIAYSSNQGTDPFTDLFVTNTDGTGRQQLTDGTGKVLYPAWSPDGAKIAWSGDPFSFVSDLDGSNRITLGTVTAGNPIWSSDGSQLALMTVDGIATVNRDGSAFTVLSPDPFVSDPLLGAPRWQPVLPAVGLVDPGTGIWRLRDWGGETTTFYYGNPGDVPFAGDWDCDGVDTPGLYRQSDGYAYLRNTNTQGIADIKFFFGNPGDVPLAGDWNADGCDTLSLYRPSEQNFYIINELGSNDEGLGAADYRFQFGNPGDSPVVGDWDGDGVDEVGLYRASTGWLAWRNTLDTGIADGSILFGNPGDRFIAGDWGLIDGTDTPAVYRPSDRTFWFRDTLTQGNADSRFTWPGASSTWIPITGDFALK